MKVLHVINSANPAHGGPIEWVKQIGTKIKSEIVCLDSKNAGWLKNSPVKVHALGPGFSKYSYSKKLVPWLKQNSGKYDAVIVHGLWRYCSFAAWKALNKSKVPYFVYTHGMLDPWFNKNKIKYAEKYLCWLLSERKVVRDAKKVIFTCEEERSIAKKSFKPYKCKESVASCGIPKPNHSKNSKELFLNRFPELKNKKILLFLGRIHRKKGCDLLINAFSKVKSDLYLVIAGPDDGEVIKLQRLAEKLGIPNKIIWTGMLNGDLKWGAFCSSEAFILPSHQENQGIAVAEAMACSIPVLISNKVNIWKKIKKQGAGLVAEDNVQGTIKLIKKWLSLSKSQREKMKNAAKKCFDENFELGKAVSKLKNVLKNGMS